MIEIAIVLLIVTIILGYTVALVPIQQELKQYRQAEAEMERIIASVYAFGQANGYLPCPAWTSDITNPAPASTSNGFECRDINGAAAVCVDGANPPDPAVDTCDVWYGYVPGKTLGLNGRYSEVNDLLVDPWGMPYRYQITDDNDDGDGLEDFVMENEMRDVRIENLAPNLSVCNADPSPGVAGGGDGACNGAPETIVANVPVVILSTGKDTAGNVAATSWIQRENLDNTPADRTFVSAPFTDAAGNEFDDLVKWVSTNTLYSKMIEAQQLP